MCKDWENLVEGLNNISSWKKSPRLRAQRILRNRRQKDCKSEKGWRMPRKQGLLNRTNAPVNNSSIHRSVTHGSQPRGECAHMPLSPAQKLCPVNNCSQRKIEFSTVESRWAYKLLLRASSMPKPIVDCQHRTELSGIFWRLCDP